MPIFTRQNGISIYYEVTDNISGKTCLLLGGLTRDHTIWRKMIPKLSLNYKVIAIDNRDAGQSTTINDKYSIADLAEDIADLLQGLELAPLHVIGHSMGGFMAIHLAAKYPHLVKTLVLCSTSEKQVSAGTEYLKNRIRLIDAQPNDNATTASRDNVIAVMDKLYAAESLLSKQFVEEVIAHETSNKYPQSASSFKRQAQACIEHDASHLLNDIRCPTLIITGEKDKYYTPELAHNLASKFENGKVIIIPNAAHMIQIEQPELVYSAFNDFISQCRSTIR
ncbi:MAG: alpha/beta fold hydrolase [Gammaproteobacteria bacterium]